ncbi:hypothetical protein, partial [Escherichia coli]|uniref:hypothetical protein n=2 Tax=Escherichia coli TaxID=562 RepID=UPI0036F328B5
EQSLHIMVAFYAVFPTKRLAHLSAGSGVFSPPAPLWFHSLHLFKFSNPCRDLAVIEKLFRFSVNTIGLHIASSIRHPIISMLRARTCRKISGKGQIQNVVITTSTT